MVIGLACVCGGVEFALAPWLWGLVVSTAAGLAAWWRRSKEVIDAPD